MKKEIIITVGTAYSAINDCLFSNGYVVMHCDTIDALPSVGDEFSMVIFLEDTVSKLQDVHSEQLIFYTNKKPIAIFVPVAFDLSNLKLEFFEMLYDFEISTGVIIKKIDEIIKNSKLTDELQKLKSENFSTETLKKELSLRDSILSHERHINANILSSITSGLIILGLDGDVIIANSQAAKLCGNSSLVGKNYKSLQTAFVDLVDSLMLEIDKAKHHEQIRKCVVNKYTLRIHGYFINSSKSTVTGILLLINDITEEENINQLLFRSEKLATVGTMLSGIAHELRNPLSIISARTQMIKMKKDYSKETILKGINTIDNQAIRCANIVNSLLNLTRNKTASSGFHQIKDIITETLNYINYQNSFDNIKVINNYDNDLILYGDRARVVQVILNLISNAVDAMDEVGTLTISTSKKSSDTVLIEINDTGSGIDPIIENKLFDPFFTTKDPGKGTGLGLAIVYKIVSEINGAIWFNSTVGDTTFFIELPTTKGAKHELSNTSR